MKEPQVQNIVCTCNVGCTLYLEGLQRALIYGEYNPKRFAAVTFRLHTPRTTALFFGSGKIVCTGARTIMEARLALIIYVSLIRTKMNLDVQIYQFEIQNIVSSATIGHEIDLVKMQKEHETTSSYEPELFPGLIYRNHTYPSVVLIFDSGRIVITGCKLIQDVHHTFKLISPILHHYKTIKRSSSPKESFEDISHKILYPITMKDIPQLINEIF